MSQRNQEKDNDGKKAFTKRNELLKVGLNRDIKKRMVKTLIWSVMLYRAETWTIRKEDVKRIEAFEMWIWRRMERISWTDRRTNKEVLKKVEKRSLMDIIRTSQKNWFGSIPRGNSLQSEAGELPPVISHRRFPPVISPGSCYVA